MNRLHYKRYLAKLWPTQKNRKIILIYHSIGNSTWAMPQQQFRDQVNWLMDHVQVLTLTNLIHSKSSALQVALTFDDGYATLYDQAAPLLAHHKIGGMIYLNTGWINEEKNKRKSSIAALGHYPDEFFLNWKEVKDLHQAGWEMGSHGVNHYDFTRLEKNILQLELFSSKQEIEKQLNVSCLHFAYPWGKHSKNLRENVKKIGYQYAASACHGKLTSRSDLFSLPRINIANHYSFEDFKNIIQGKWDYLQLFHKIKGL